MRHFLVIVVVLLVLALASCAGSSQSVGTEPTANSARPLAPQEKALWDRAQASFQAADGGHWEEMYEFVSPQARETCEREAYSGMVASFATLVRGFTGLGGDVELVLRLEDVAVTDTKGTVFLSVFANNHRLDYAEETKRRWVLLDGEWWEEYAAWSYGCVGWKLFE